MKHTVLFLMFLICFHAAFAVEGSNVSAANSTLDNVAPAVALLSPSGGQILTAGETIAITWTASDTNLGSNPIRLEYSVDGGNVFTDIVAATANDGSYDWLIPGIASTAVRLRITATDGFGINSSFVSATDLTVQMNQNVIVSSGNISGAEIFADGISTGYSAPHTFVLPQGSSVTYTVQKTDYSWVLASGSDSNVITNLDGGKNIVFTGTYTYIDPLNPGFTYTGDPDIPISGIAGTIETLLVPLPAVSPVGAVVMVFTGSTTCDLTITVPLGTWYVIAYYNDPLDGGLTWHHGNPYPAVGIGDVIFANVPFGAKAEIPVIIDEADNTLPVELSSFTAIATEQYFVHLQWTTQSETNLSGYQIYRNTSSDLGTALCLSTLIPAANSSQETDYSFADNDATAGSTYFYWLQALNLDGTHSYHGPISITLTGDGSDPDQPIIPLSTCLLPNYPNPFNPQTSLVYQLCSPGSVELNIFNAKGQKVRSFQKQHTAAGTYNVIFDGRDTLGRALSSGVYYCTMQAGASSYHHKMVLLK
jgi:hypothetical protein